MKIAVYSGCFDPPTLGHQWVMEEAKKLFDKVFVVIGRHPRKTPMFNVDERKYMITEMVPGIHVDHIRDDQAHIIDYVQNKFPKASEIVLVRGLRDESDFISELDLVDGITVELDDVGLSSVRQVFLIPPGGVRSISSSHAKWLWEQQMWGDLRLYVPPVVSRMLGPLRVFTEEPASIFEQTTAGFGLGVYGGMSQSHHTIKMVDELPPPIPTFCEDDARITVRRYLDKAVTGGFVHYAERISADQVRSTLDPFPIDVAVSDMYHLREITVKGLGCLGKRYISHSHSLGPIVVDANLNFPDISYPVIVIEGKHRMLDARARGEKTILAWVGDRALEVMKNEAKQDGVPHMRA